VTSAVQRFLQTASASSSVLRHGVKITARMMDTHGEDAALAWFHEHELLPAHIEARCPMAAALPE